MAAATVTRIASDSTYRGVSDGASSSRPIRLLIADENRMGCQLLGNALHDSRQGFEVFASVTSRPEILSSLEAHPANVAVINEDLEDGPFMGFQILSELRSCYPDTRVVVLLRASSRELVIDAFRGGAKGVFCRTEPVENLCKCICAVHAGQVWANSNEMQFVLEGLVNAAPLRVVSSQGLRLLAKREDDVVNLVAEGLTNRDVAKKLGLSEHTVSNYLFRIYNKLGISSRVELVLYVMRQRQQSAVSSRSI